MTDIDAVHEALGATFTEHGGRRVVDHYGRPARAHRAVRNGVGVLEAAYGTVVVTGDDRIEFVDNVVSNRVPHEEGRGCHALLLDPQGRIEVDLTIYHAGDRLLLFTPPGKATAIADDWSEKVFIQDVTVEAATDAYGTFSVHGPTATEKVASVLVGAAAPEERFTFVRGSIADAGVTVVRTDAPCGEESYDVICATADAESVFDALLTSGPGAAPFGYATWGSLTLEAGTPLFETELEGTIPNVLGLRSALDFEKGCYVGQEVVSRVENRGQPSRRLVGLELGDASIPDAGATVFDGDATIGEVTRAVESPIRESVLALALVDFGLDAEAVSVRIGGEEYDASVVALPLVEGSERSGRLPVYG